MQNNSIEQFNYPQVFSKITFDRDVKFTTDVVHYDTGIGHSLKSKYRARAACHTRRDRLKTSVTNFPIGTLVELVDHPYCYSYRENL